MKPNITKQLASVVILPSVVLAFTACSNIGLTETTTMVNASNGAAVVETYTNSATVTAIDTANRKLSLKLANGTRKTVKCGSGVVNFPKIKVGNDVNLAVVKVGDHVTVRHTEAMAIVVES